MFKIVTAESRPFVITYQIPKGGNCSDLNIVERGLKRQFVKCVGPSTHLPGNEHCCTGKRTLAFLQSSHIAAEGWVR